MLEFVAIDAWSPQAKATFFLETITNRATQNAATPTKPRTNGKTSPVSARVAAVEPTVPSSRTLTLTLSGVKFTVAAKACCGIKDAESTARNKNREVAKAPNLALFSEESPPPQL